MNEHRFHLQKYRRGTKTTCPQCGRKYCFVHYVDAEERITFPDHVGRCDHEQSCGYHYPPSAYFKDNPNARERKEEWEKPIAVKPLPKPKPTSYIDKVVMERTLRCYDINPLYLFLSKIFGREETTRIFLLYKVGTSRKWGGSTVYWQIDHEQRVRTGKIMLYDGSNGHRVKEPRSYVSWVHTELHLVDFNMKQCLFGEHLLPTYPTKPVGIVESEKSALIATHFMPDFIWLATGGMHGCFKAESMQILRGRIIMLFPDLGAFDVWKAKVPMLQAIGSKVIISEELERIATDEQRQHGLDVADFLLLTETPQMRLQKMMAHNPALRMLVEKLELELIE